MYRSLIASALGAAWLTGCGGSGAESPAPPAFEPHLVADGRPGGALLGIWSSRTGDAAQPEPVWFVGGAAGESLVLRYSDGRWDSLDPALHRRLWWVHGTAEDAVFVVGEAGAAARWDGEAWTSIPTGIEGATLYGVWASAPDDVWTVGGPRQGAGGAAPVRYALAHWDGEAWTRLSIPVLDAKPSSDEIALFKIWGASKDELIAVGETGLALHWNGAGWRQEPTGVTAGTLFTVTGRSAGDAFAIGGFNESVIVHWDGRVWTRVAAGELVPGTTQGIFTAPGLDALYTGGLDGYLGRRVGDVWTERDFVSSFGFHAVWADGAGRVWAAGGDIVGGSPELGTIATTGEGVTALE